MKSKGYTPEEADKMLANLESTFRPPYTLAAFGPLTATLDDMVSVPADVRAQSASSIGEIVAVFRALKPTGRFSICVFGTSPGHKRPVAFIDTGLAEKAIRHRRRAR